MHIMSFVIKQKCLGKAQQFHVTFPSETIVTDHLFALYTKELWV